MRPGRMNHRVTLWRSPQTTPDSDGFFEALNPGTVWAQVEPIGPDANGRTVTHIVTVRYHAQITMDSMVKYGTRELFVRGVQDVDDKHVELRLLCEEIIP